ncbi:MAG TPA: hypothetical protein VJ521_05825, partial [Acidobacteriota bacterium]|nr:hypothetical protein [Acidobacteriota bacterium]
EMEKSRISIGIASMLFALSLSACAEDKCEEDPGAEGCACYHGYAEDYNGNWDYNMNRDCNFGLVCTTDNECRSGDFQWSSCMDFDNFGSCDRWCEALGATCGTGCDHGDLENRAMIGVSWSIEEQFCADPDYYDADLVSEGYNYVDDVTCRSYAYNLASAASCCCAYL